MVPQDTSLIAGGSLFRTISRRRAIYLCHKNHVFVRTGAGHHAHAILLW